MKAIVVGSGAGGGTAARELAMNGFDVTILEAGKVFKPFTRRLTMTEPLRKAGLLGGEKTIGLIFPYMDVMRSEKDLVLVRGIGTGGCTTLSCGNMVRADHGLKEIGLDLTPEFEELENIVGVKPFPKKRWRPLTRTMFESAAKLGLNPHPTPKAVEPRLCTSCGLCEMGCSTGARWDSRQFLEDALKMGALLHTSSPVQRVVMENGCVKGVVVKSGRSNKVIEGDVVVLAAGGIGTAQILKNSDLPAEDHLWVDIVLTLGGISKGAKQLKEPPMLWYTEHDNYILSPYLDVLSHWFHKPWRNVSLEDRVGIMVKMADMEEGTVSADGSVNKNISSEDRTKIDMAVSHAKEIMETSGVSGPFVKGMYNGGHLGGTVPLKKEDVASMKPSWLPDGLWVADLSLAPRSQGLPTILLASAMALRVARKIIQD
ncbi:GMC family oxidoreductase N-terminal domain-containing protein [Methanobacterium aggregans]|uniref:GMC family oxidoreductase N-terminal domain-containing protein n=1 Tax=Methanobacterium aggregans TaxID=1615586 RepID=UPI001AEABAFE|nr:GMC family oxidoreductase N-terminal domain-containing protein [Methanobacterium aggregans]MBP2046395.1 choline dehydrogenase-like flavoprotein [Methanobacterium aggregans]